VLTYLPRRYPGVLTAQLQYLYENGRMAKVMLKIQQNIKVAVQGQMPHAETILSALVAKLSEVLILGSSGQHEEPEAADEKNESYASPPEKHGSSYSFTS
jgi:hypothetical protein